MGWSAGEIEISVIIPVYNAEKYLKRCLDSIMAQTYKNFEIICVDDGSTDNSGTILDSYADCKKNIKVQHIRNNGVGNARNLGIKLSQGNYIIFVDADDIIEPLLFEKVVRAFEEEPADVCVFDVVINYYGHIKKESSIRNVKKGDIGNLDTYNTFLNYFLSGPRSVCNRAFSRLLLINESLAFTNLKNGEDGIFLIEVYSKANKIIYLPFAGYHYIFNKSSATQISKDEKFIYSISLFHEVAKKLSDRFTEFDYMKVINTHFLNAFIETIGNYVLMEKQIDKSERKSQFDRILAESSYDFASENFDFSHLSLTAKVLLSIGKLTYEKVYFISMLKKIVKCVIK